MISKQTYTDLLKKIRGYWERYCVKWVRNCMFSTQKRTNNVNVIELWHMCKESEHNWKQEFTLWLTVAGNRHTTNLIQLRIKHWCDGDYSQLFRTVLTKPCISQHSGSFLHKPKAKPEWDKLISAHSGPLGILNISEGVVLRTYMH